MAKNRIHLLELAQEKLGECIRLLELACDGDGNAEAYLVNQLKIFKDDEHGFLCDNLNIDRLIKRYDEEDRIKDVSDQETEEMLERMGLN
jgi:hypothetical protein